MASFVRETGESILSTQSNLTRFFAGREGEEEEDPSAFAAVEQETNASFESVLLLSFLLSQIWPESPPLRAASDLNADDDDDDEDDRFKIEGRAFWVGEGRGRSFREGE